ncbi:TPA: hypothetical protein P2R06_001962 [Aeromonas veronii]|nr:hypothetical protein [Aeromonas veronii]
MTNLERNKIILEVIEKGLVSITLVFAIITSTYKGYEFLSLKSKETEKRTEAIELLTSSYVKSLSNLDHEIKDLDDKLANTIYKGSYDWDKFSAIRDAKARDRNSLLEKLGMQIVELKKAEK